jgi:hypothetical protein
MVVTTTVRSSRRVKNQTPKKAKQTRVSINKKTYQPKRLPTPKHGSILRDSGYSQREPSAVVRHAAIVRAIPKWKKGQNYYQNALGLYRHMILIYNLAKNCRQKGNKEDCHKRIKTFKEDIEWLKKLKDRSKILYLN